MPRLKLADRWFNEFDAASGGAGPGRWYWLSVPAAVIGFVGVLWNAPVPQAFASATPTLNWGALFLMATVVYYFIVSIPLALGTLPFIILTIAALSWLGRFDAPLLPICGTLFLAAWLGRCGARGLRGAKPACGKELQLLMIGPLWLLGRLYRHLGIPY
jgi:hypothetical protein